MSSTRRSSSGEFHQERFCSAPEFEGDTINGLAVAKRIAIVKNRATREVLWWLQWLSLTPGALQELSNELFATFPERIGTPTFRKLRNAGDRILRRAELETLEKEFGYYVASARYFSAAIGGVGREDFHWADGDEIISNRISDFEKRVHDAFLELRDTLVRFCLDPQEDIAKGVWYFEDLLGALTILRERFVATARTRLADTAITRTINETLDFWYSRKRMVLIEGVAGIGRSETTKAWRDAHAGMVRYVEVPSSSDDRSFFASIARQLGVACGVSFKAQQIKVRIEEMLAGSELYLALDESQYLWGQAMRPRKTPDRLLWIKSTFDAGTPIALIAHTDFSKWQKHFVDRTLWTDEQFERRVNRRIVLPTEHSKEDMLKIARAHFPAGDSRSWKLLAAYGLGTEKKQASGIVEALESARYRAEQAGRAEPGFADIEAVLIYVHHFLTARPDGALSAVGGADAQPLQPLCKRSAKMPRRVAGESDFSIRVRPHLGRITIPTGAV